MNVTPPPESNPYAPPVAPTGPARPPARPILPSQSIPGGMFLAVFGWVGFDLGRNLMRLILYRMRTTRGQPPPAVTAWEDRMVLIAGLVVAVMAVGGMARYWFGRNSPLRRPPRENAA